MSYSTQSCEQPFLIFPQYTHFPYSWLLSAGLRSGETLRCPVSLLVSGRGGRREDTVDCPVLVKAVSHPFTHLSLTEARQTPGARGPKFCVGEAKVHIPVSPLLAVASLSLLYPQVWGLISLKPLGDDDCENHIHTVPKVKPFKGISARQDLNLLHFQPVGDPLQNTANRETTSQSKEAVPRLFPASLHILGKAGVAQVLRSPSPQKNVETPHSERDGSLLVRNECQVFPGNCV